jgi:cytochrome c-type biogenesis protein
MGLFLTLFVAGTLSILLPCILPLVPIVLGASIAGRNKARPLVITIGMVISFVGFTFLLLLVLKYFVHVAEYLRIGTYYILLLFGLSFITQRKEVLYGGAALGSIFFSSKGGAAVLVFAALGIFLMCIGGVLAAKLQQIGGTTQKAAQDEFGSESLLTAFIIGLSMGLVWVPCAGPALGFAFALVREKPGLEAFFALTAYGLGVAVPLLLVGYGGQAAVHSVRSLTKYSGRIKHIAGGVLLLTAISLNYGWLRAIETWLVQDTFFGNVGTQIEERFFGETFRTTVIEK